MDFKDFFSKQAANYAIYRPNYPEVLFDYLSMAAPKTDAVWDCGTGNGQAAVPLAERFDRVYATDPSAKQLKECFLHPRVSYSLASAEKSGLEERSVSLITVAQAFHWFDQDLFVKEVQRVGRSGGLLAIWCYGNCTVSPEIDAVVNRLYSDIVGPYWDEARKMVDNGYEDVELPLEEAHPPQFDMTMQWSLDHYVGYINTWSATQKYISVNGTNPLQLISEDLVAAWGEMATRVVAWPLTFRSWIIE